MPLSSIYAPSRKSGFELFEARPRTLLFLFIVSCLIGCGSTPTDPVDASDASDEMDGASDSEVDSAEDAEADVLDASDGGATGETPLLMFGATQISLTNTRYGVNADGTFRFELYAGSNGECPSMDSPTPDQTIVIGSVPNEPGEHDVSAVLFDFAEGVTMEPLLRAESAAVTLSEASGSGENIPLDADFSASFSEPSGELSGSGTITHCPSLDE